MASSRRAVKRARVGRFAVFGPNVGHRFGRVLWRRFYGERGSDGSGVNLWIVACVTGSGKGSMIIFVDLCDFIDSVDFLDNHTSSGCRSESYWLTWCLTDQSCDSAV